MPRPPLRACVASLLLLCLALTTCGGGGDDEGPPSAEEQAEQRASALLTRMTLDEKIQLVHGVGFREPGAGFIDGIPRLGVPDLAMVDSASGINLPDSGSTALPAPLALAASWDPLLATRYGQLIGQELRALGFAVGLGTGINLTREPRNGRTFEYMGEDPVLAGLMAAHRTEGTQGEQVIATIKHFALNQQETRRYESNSVVDERTMRELELLAFELAIKRSRPGNVMCGYNRINGLKACEHGGLLNGVLKQEWGYRGVVQADWIYGITDTVRAALAGTDEEQPGSEDDSIGTLDVPTFFNQKLKAAVQAGQVPLARLDDMVLRKLRTLYRIGLMDDPPRRGGSVDRAAGEALAEHIAAQGMVLLKNSPPADASRPVLPLQADALQSVVVVGGHADVGVISGGGSAKVPAHDGNPVSCLQPDPPVDPRPVTRPCAIYYRSSPLEAIRTRLPQARVQYVDGSDAAAAAAAASSADVALVFATQWTTEQRDLPSLALPGPGSDPWNYSHDQEALITAVAAANPHTVVVLQTGTAVTMPWLDAVPAVLQAWYPGIRGGPAMAQVLFGEVNPSGRLPMSFPRREGDLPQPAISTTDLDVVYHEGVAMGYRWFDARGIEPLFAFGHGLSYTTFAYSMLELSKAGPDTVAVHLRVQNTGSRAGAEVVQVYASLPAAAGDAPQRLVAWRKVWLAPGEARELTVTVERDRLAAWDTQLHQRRLLPGRYRLKAGRSSRDPDALQAELDL